MPLLSKAWLYSRGFLLIFRLYRCLCTIRDKAIDTHIGFSCGGKGIEPIGCLDRMCWTRFVSKVKKSEVCLVLYEL